MVNSWSSFPRRACELAEPGGTVAAVPVWRPIAEAASVIPRQTTTAAANVALGTDLPFHALFHTLFHALFHVLFHAFHAVFHASHAVFDVLIGRTQENMAQGNEQASGQIGWAERCASNSFLHKML